MRALVTGSTGYIGSHLVAHLPSNGMKVAVLARQRMSYLPDNVTEYLYDGSSASVVQACGAFRPNVIFHLASLSKAVVPADDIPAMASANIMFGTQLLEAAQLCGCQHFINTGSYWQYGTNGDISPNSLYASYKQAFETIIDFYVSRHALHALTLVLFDVYGPQDKRNRVIDQFITNALEQRRMQTTEGHQYLDFVHISDVCRGYSQAASWLHDQPQSKQFHFALDTGIRYSLRDVAAFVENATGKKLDVEWGAFPYPPHQVFAPVNTIQRLPGWEPTVNLLAGITEQVSALKTSILA